MKRKYEKNTTPNNLERICPNCGTLIKYKSYNTWYMAKKINTKCKICLREQKSKLRKGISIEKLYGEEKAKEIREKNRIGHLGQKPTIENLKKLKLSHLGISRTEETKLKISKANTGKKLSEETKEKISNSLKGRSPSEESKKKMSESCKGIKKGPMSKETKQKIREARAKQITSDETRLKMRLIVIKKLKERLNKNFQIFPNYNPKGCECFNKLMKETNTFIQHAENGGEFHIKELGYFVDGYDSKNNIVYEYDEEFHKKRKI